VQSIKFDINYCDVFGFENGACSHLFIVITRLKIDMGVRLNKTNRSANYKVYIN
jgi:hypothetical protein